MSTGTNQVLSTWKHVWGQLRRNRYKITEDLEASDDDNITIADCYLLHICLMSDLCDALPGPVLSGINRYYVLEPVTTVIDRYTALDTCLLQVVQTEVDPWSIINECFKRTLEDFPHSGRWLWLITKVAERCIGRARSDVEAFKYLHQIFCFPGRLSLDGRTDLMAKASAAFLKQEELLRYQYAGVGIPLQRIIRRWFPNTIETYESIYGDWVPRHGNGSVAEGPLNYADKYHELRTDSELEALNLLTGGLGYPRLIPFGLNRTAVVQFVPKSASKLRTICMEPASLQFQQQAGMRSLVSYFGKHPYLRRRIDLSNSQYNADLAQIGSVDGSFATIDLSAASDSVSWKLVRSAFDGTPLLPMLAYTRSRYEKMPGGEILRTKKFAPMGSALCFPIECLIFAAIVEYAIDRAGDPPKRSLYCVYGDDIVVETKYAEKAITALEEFGFTVNRDKSFYTITHLNFRESCGGEFLFGDDVAPVRVPRRFRGIRSDKCLADAGHYEGLIDLANSLRTISPTGRLMILQVLNHLPKWARPLYVAIGEEGGIESPQPTNHRNYVREFVDPQVTPNIPYQRTMVKHGTAKPQRGRIVEEDEDIRLYECLRAMAESPDGRETEGETFIDHQDEGPKGRRLTSRWS